MRALLGVGCNSSGSTAGCGGGQEERIGNCLGGNKVKTGDQMVVGVKVRRGQRRLPAAWEIGMLLTEAGGGIEEFIWGGITVVRWVEKGHTSRAGSQGSVEASSGFFLGGAGGVLPH